MAVYAWVSSRMFRTLSTVVVLLSLYLVIPTGIARADAEIANTGPAPICRVEYQCGTAELISYTESVSDTTMAFRITNATCQNAISHVAVGVDDALVTNPADYLFNPISPVENSVYSGTRGSYLVSWTNGRNDQPPFESIKFDVSGGNEYGVGVSDVFTITLGEFDDEKHPITIQAKHGNVDYFPLFQDLSKRTPAENCGGDPLATTLEQFSTSMAGDHAMIRWYSSSEVDTVGYNILRAESPDVEPVVVNESMIPALNPGSPAGAGYEFADYGISVGGTYYYYLETITGSGARERVGPNVMPTMPTAISLGALEAEGASSGSVLVPLGLMVALLTVAIARRRRDAFFN